MTFEELMLKLKHWILNNWNPNNSDFKVSLNALEVNPTEYRLTPESKDNFLLMSFKKTHDINPYQLSIKLDNCKFFFKGVARFQMFHDEVLTVLRQSLPCSLVDEDYSMPTMKR